MKTFNFANLYLSILLTTVTPSLAMAIGFHDELGIDLEEGTVERNTDSVSQPNVVNDRSEVASPEPVAAESATPKPVVAAETELRSENAQALFGEGKIPSLSGIDNRYTAKDTKEHCKEAWDAVKRRQVTVKPIRASLETILKKAKAAGAIESQVKKTLATYLANQSRLPNQKYLSIIDYSGRSDTKRWFVIDLETGDTKGYHVAHGENSDTNANGWVDGAKSFTNQPKTDKSSKGCFVVAGEFESGKHGKALLAHGMEEQNNNMCNRAIIIHKANYVGGVPGRSHGCPAVRPQDQKEIYGKITGGSLSCAYHDDERYYLQKADEKKAAVKKKSPSKKKKKKNNSRRRRG